jgi:hypothetical protein
VQCGLKGSEIGGFCSLPERLGTASDRFWPIVLKNVFAEFAAPRRQKSTSQIFQDRRSQSADWFDNPCNGPNREISELFNRIGRL